MASFGASIFHDWTPGQGLIMGVGDGEGDGEDGFAMDTLKECRPTTEGSSDTFTPP